MTDIPVDDKFDVLVIDEAQDLMNFSALERLESTVIGNWSDGRWVMFMDQNRQAHLYAELAVAKSQSADARKSADEVLASLNTLRQETERTTPTQR